MNSFHSRRLDRYTRVVGLDDVNCSVEILSSELEWKELGVLTGENESSAL